MPILFFPDFDSLRLVLTSGVVPLSISRSPTVVGFDPQGHLWLQPESPIQRDIVAALSRFGVRVLGSSAATQTETVGCWHQLMPLQPDSMTAPKSPVLIELSSDQIARYAAEIRRLTHQSISFRWIDEDLALMRVVRPPSLTLLRVLDRNDLSAPRAFVEQAPNVWVPLGWTHPLAAQIQPPDGQILLIRPPFDWVFLDDVAFYESLPSYPTIAPKSRWKEVKPARRLSIPMRLVSSHSESSPELWVLDEDPLGQLEELVLHLDERILARLTIAMTQSSSVILRVKHGKSGIPTLMVNGRGYAPFMKLPQLFVPTGMALRPNIRRDALRHLLARDGRKITWLRPLDEGQFTIESIAENAFHPLIEAYEYHVEELAQSFTAWKPSDAFPLEPFVQRIEDVAATIREDRAQHNANIAPTEERRRGMLNRLRDMFGNLWPSAPAPQTPPPKTRREKAPLNVDETLKAVLRRPDDKKVVFEDRPGEHQQRRQALEAKILANIAQSESVKRVEDWQELAALYRRANNHADAALCWLNVMWDQPELSTHAAWGWLHSESRGIRGTELNVNRREGNEEIPFSRWLEQIPTPSHARSLAAYVVWASLQNPFPPTFIANLNPLQSYLTEHENWLPIRALWLMRSALANLMKDDVLALARTRDRVVERMQESGLSLDLDVPSFLRFSTHGVSERFQKVRDWLKRLREPIRRWLSEQASGRSLLNRTPLAQDLPASRSASRMSEFGLDPELQFTPAYVDLILAWGLSRLSEHNASRDLIQQSSRLLSQGDPVHEILLDAYRYRIQQVQEGRASRGPLPTELLKRIGGLKPAVGSRHEPRYVVDKLRQHSRILEPSERMDAFRNPLRYQGASAEVRLALAGMPDIADNGELTERARQLFTHATRTGDSPSLPAVLLGILDVASRLGENILIPALREVGVAIELLTAMPPRVRLLDQAIFVAVQLGHASIVKDLLGRFRTILESQRGLFALRAIEPLTGESFRGLRRLGLRDECEQLLQRMEAWVLGGHDLKSLREKQPKEWPIALRTLLHIAAGWLFCGQDDRAKATLDEARDQLLYGGELPASEQTALALTYTATLSHADSRIALGRLEELFQRLRHVQLNSSTNSHYMLKPLELVETVVRSVVNDSFTLGPAVRRWLDDDEFLIRQHLDRDLRAVMEKQGLE